MFGLPGPPARAVAWELHSQCCDMDTQCLYTGSASVKNDHVSARVKNENASAKNYNDVHVLDFVRCVLYLLI